MNTWRTLLPHELDDVEKKIEAGEALDIGLLRSLVKMARYYDRGWESGWVDGYNSGYDDGIES